MGTTEIDVDYVFTININSHVISLIRDYRTIDRRVSICIEDTITASVCEYSSGLLSVL